MQVIGHENKSMHSDPVTKELQVKFIGKDLPYIFEIAGKIFPIICSRSNVIRKLSTAYQYFPRHVSLQLFRRRRIDSVEAESR